MVAAKPGGFGLGDPAEGAALEGGILNNPIEVSALDIDDRRGEFTPLCNDQFHKDQLVLPS